MHVSHTLNDSILDRRCISTPESVHLTMVSNTIFVHTVMKFSESYFMNFLARGKHLFINFSLSICKNCIFLLSFLQMKHFASFASHLLLPIVPCNPGQFHVGKWSTTSRGHAAVHHTSNVICVCELSCYLLAFEWFYNLPFIHFGYIDDCIGGADVTAKRIPTTIQIIWLKNIQLYSESNWFKFNHKIWFEFTDLKKILI
jgi:hypothetical protein